VNEPSSVREETHLRVLRLVEVNPRVSQRELALLLGASLGKTNYCLKALVDRGLIKVQNFRKSDHKLAYTYLLTPTGIAKKADLMRRFLRRKIVEYEVIRQEIELLKLEMESNRDGA
jgi:MarR family transcriptional regulator, temperature-dependent positive regulator of motility